MSVWLAIPSKRPPEEAEKCLKEWRERGYKIALLCDDSVRRNVDLQIISVKYGGYAASCNELIAHISGGKLRSPTFNPTTGAVGHSIVDYEGLAHDPTAEWFVCAGDDTLPDPNHSAEEIAAECSRTFMVRGEVHLATKALPDGMATFGVMQPTGDRWQEGMGGFTNAPIDRVAGSPWIGREFARRMYGGTGPYWHEYTHCFVDEELQCVAEKVGVFWQRRDLIHKHMHWARGATDKEIVNVDRMPAFLAEANSAAHWRKFKAIFEARQAAGFPGHEPIA